MDNKGIGHHISQQFNVELDDLRSRVLAMGGLVEKQIVDAVTALVDGDAELLIHKPLMLMISASSASE